eukprot:COSAG06_NODE_24604_length_657_cov_2.279570_1_plen_21_part_10
MVSAAHRVRLPLMGPPVALVP